MEFRISPSRGVRVPPADVTAAPLDIYGKFQQIENWKVSRSYFYGPLGKSSTLTSF